MSQEFIEGLSTDAESPNETHEEFDWSSLSRGLGEAGDEVEPPDEREKLSRAIAFILDWQFAVDTSRPDVLTRIGHRAVAMAWVLDPQRFGDRCSLRSLAKQLGFTAPNISPEVAEFSRKTGLRNQFQVHDWKNS